MLEFYVNQYGGSTLSGEELPELVRRAEDRLRRYERDFRVSGDERARKMALCAMAEALHKCAGRNGVAAATVGGVSVRYEKQPQKLLLDAARIYLDIYRGVS